MKRVGVARSGRKDASVIDQQWHDLKVVDEKRDPGNELKRQFDRLS